MRDEIFGTVFRWTLGVLFFSIFGWFLKHAYDNADVVWILLSIPFFILGALSFWKTIFYLLTRPFLLLIDSIFFPGGKLAKPVLNLKLPSYYINQERYTEALEEYTKILKHHPTAAEAYEKAIWLYLEIFDEPGNARKLLRKAKSRGVSLDERVVRMVDERDRKSELLP